MSIDIRQCSSSDPVIKTLPDQLGHYSTEQCVSVEEAMKAIVLNATLLCFTLLVGVEGANLHDRDNENHPENTMNTQHIPYEGLEHRQRSSKSGGSNGDDPQSDLDGVVVVEEPKYHNVEVGLLGGTLETR